MRLQIGGKPVEQARAIKHSCTQPSSVIGGFHNAQVTLVPSALEIGVDVGAGGHNERFL